MAKIVEESTENTAPKTMATGDAVRYSAIELIEDSNASPTTHSDTYSFAMLVIECITEKVPFSDLPNNDAVIHARVIRKQLPSRPNGQEPRHCVSDNSWEYMTDFWSLNLTTDPRCTRSPLPSCPRIDAVVYRRFQLAKIWFSILCIEKRYAWPAIVMMSDERNYEIFEYLGPAQFRGCTKPALAKMNYITLRICKIYVDKVLGRCPEGKPARGQHPEN